jgi:hypothetical protein
VCSEEERKFQLHLPKGMWVHIVELKSSLFKTHLSAGHWCLMPVILATWEAKIRRIMV